MKQNINTAIRIALSLFVLVGAWVIGAIIAGSIFPQAHSINKMETLSGKIGSSIGVLVASFLLAKYILKTSRQVVLCFIVVETFALIVVLSFTQLWRFTWFDFKFNIEWLFVMTWNVAIAYVIGSAIGHRMIKKR